ncbi:Crp/Fnr family transcriptional regulator [Spirosoma arcticum]
MQQEWSEIRAFLDNLIELTDEIWQAVVSIGHPTHYAKKQPILQPGQICDQMIFIHRGTIRSYRLQEGVDTTYFLYFPREFPFATEFTSFRTNQPTEFYLECVDDCQVTVFYRRDIDALYERHHAMEKLGRLMAEQAYLMLDRRMSHFQFHDLQTRYLSLLAEEPGLLQRVPQHLIATYLGVTPESLSRIKQAVARRKK